jgi:hypothetical protein
MTMQEKIMGLGTGEKLVAGGGVLMLIASFLDWWKFNAPDIADAFGFSGYGGSGWDAPGSIWSTLAILISIVLAGVIIATRLFNVQMPALPQNVTWSQVWGGGSAAVVVLILLKAWRILALPSGYGFDIGFWVAVVATVLVAAGGYMLYTQEKAGS